MVALGRGLWSGHHCLERKYSVGTQKPEDAIAASPGRKPGFRNRLPQLQFRRNNDVFLQLWIGNRPYFGQRTVGGPANLVRHEGIQRIFKPGSTPMCAFFDVKEQRARYRVGRRSRWFQLLGRRRPCWQTVLVCVFCLDARP